MHGLRLAADCSGPVTGARGSNLLCVLCRTCDRARLHRNGRHEAPISQKKLPKSELALAAHSANFVRALFHGFVVGLYCLLQGFVGTVGGNEVCHVAHGVDVCGFNVLL